MPSLRPPQPALRRPHSRGDGRQARAGAADARCRARQPHRPAQPRAVSRPPGDRRQARHARAAGAAGPAVHRHRQVQVGEHRVRPHRRRQPAADHRPAPRPQPRARRTRWAASAATSSRCCCSASPMPRELAMLAEQVRRSLRAPINIAGQEIVLTASIGIALYDGPDEDPAELLREAEIAMYRAKRAGPTGSRSSTPACAPRRTAGRRSRADLRRAIEKKQLRLVYQPIFYLPTEIAGRLRGAAALGASDASAPSIPTDFVPIAEESDLIVKLGSYVLARAVREAARWHKELPRAGCSPVRRRQRVEPAAVPAGAGQGGAPHPRPRRDPQGLAAARDHRSRWSWRTRRRRRPCCGSSPTPAPAWRSTISAPAIRRSPISTSSPSTPSRSTARSCMPAARTAPAR